MKYSVVIPLKNEEENIEELVAEIHPVMESLNTPWELICIDDGSTDSTLKLLRKLQQDHKNLRVIKFSKNFGQSSAFDAGFKAAAGEFVITLDGDRQNDPSDIPKLIEKLGSADLVCGERLNRQDPIIKKLTSKLANFVRSRVCKDGMKDTGCSLKVYRRSCLKSISLFEGMHRFLPALFLAHGFRVDRVPVNHRERTKGTSKYSFSNRSLNTVYDMIAVRWMRTRLLNYQIDEETSHG